ncbi:MAG: hypothetical protein V4478_02980 [Patescibacteria group bacterium]
MFSIFNKILASLLFTVGFHHVPPAATLPAVTHVQTQADALQAVNASSNNLPTPSLKTASNKKTVNDATTVPVTSLAPQSKTDALKELEEGEQTTRESHQKGYTNHSSNCSEAEKAYYAIENESKVAIINYPTNSNDSEQAAYNQKMKDLSIKEQAVTREYTQACFNLNIPSAITH